MGKALDLTEFGGGNQLDLAEFSKPPTSNAARVMSDMGKSLKSGVLQLPGQLTGLADLAPALTMGARPFTNAANALGDMTGFTPGKWAKDIQYSPEAQRSQAEIDKVWEDQNAGAADVAGAYLTHPAYTANQVVQSVPGMVAGGVASKLLMGAGAVAPVVEKGIAAVPGYLDRVVGSKMAAPIAGGIGEGAQQTGQQMDQGSELPDQRKNAAAALASGVIDAGIGAGLGRAANAMGLETAQTLMAKGLKYDQAAKPLKMGVRMAGGAADEAAQEVLQSGQEQAWQNFAEDKPLGEGVARQAIEGGLAGGVMGAGANVMGGHAAPAAPPPVVIDPNAGPISRAAAMLALPNAQTLTGDNAGTVLTGQNRADAALNSGNPIVETGDQGGGRGSEILPPEQPGYPAPQAGAPALPFDNTETGVLVAGPDGVLRPEVKPEVVARNNAAQAHADQQAAAAQVQPDDIQGEQGRPFKTRIAAMAAAKRAGAGFQPAAVDGGGFVVRRAVQDVTDVVAKTEIDTAAHAAATSPHNDLPEPTDGQKEAGNYQKGHVQLHGLDVTVENPRGSDRTGKRPDGSQWSHTMSDHYGYIKRTVGADDEQVDVYLGPDAHQGEHQVYVVDQLHQDTGKFDEHKAMLGYPDEASAVAAYKSNFDKGWKVGSVTPMSIDNFKGWLKNGDTKAEAAKAAQSAAPDAAAAQAGQAAGSDAAGNGLPVDHVPPVQLAPQLNAGPKPLTVGITPSNALPVTVKAGVVHVGNSQAVNFETGDPVTVPDGATHAQIKQALKDAGALTNRQKFFGGNKDEEVANAPAAGPVSSAPAAAPAAAAAPEVTSTAQKLASAAEEPATPAPTPTEVVGRDGKAISDGGKPFKTKLGAIQYQKQNHPQSRIVKAQDGKGFVLVDRTDKELAAQQSNAKKMRTANRQRAYEKNPFLEWLGGHGLFHVKGHKRSLKTEFSPDKNPMTTSGPLFRRTGIAVDLLASRAAQDGFLPPGSDDAHALETLIHRALRGERIAPVYAEGEAEKEMQARMDAMQAASFDEVLQADSEDPLALDDMDFTPEEIEAGGYSELSPEQQAEFRALLALAESHGVDVETIKEDAYNETAHQSEQAYYDAAITALKAALAGSAEGRSQDVGAPRDAQGEPADPSEEVAPDTTPAASRKANTEPGETPAPGKRETPLASALRDYEDTGVIATVQDLVDEVESLIDDDKAPESLQSAVDDYRAALREDREELGMRGDADGYENKFLDAVRAALQPQAPKAEAATPAAGNAETTAEADQQLRDSFPVGQRVREITSSRRDTSDHLGRVTESDGHGLSIEWDGHTKQIPDKLHLPWANVAKWIEPIGEDLTARLDSNGIKQQAKLERGELLINDTYEKDFAWSDSRGPMKVGQGRRFLIKTSKGTVQINLTWPKAAPVPWGSAAYGTSISSTGFKSLLSGTVAATWRKDPYASALKIIDDLQAERDKAVAKAAKSKKKNVIAQGRDKKGGKPDAGSAPVAAPKQPTPKPQAAAPVRVQGNEPEFKPLDVIMAITANSAAKTRNADPQLHAAMVKAGLMDNKEPTAAAWEFSKKLMGRDVPLGQPQPTAQQLQAMVTDKLGKRPFDTPAKAKKAATETVPQTVKDSVRHALGRLREVEQALAGVERARGRGHILALEMQDQAEKVSKARAKLDEFRTLAKAKGIDPEATIKELGGEPDLERFNVTPVKGGPVAPAPTNLGSKVTPQVPLAQNPGKATPSAEELRARADLLGALGDLGDILSKPGRANITPEQEAKLMPVLSRVFDAAFRLGYIKFKQAAKYVLDQIRAALGDDVANEISIDHLQGAYIAMAGKYRDQGSDAAKAVVAVDSKAEIEAAEAQDIENDGESADTEDNHVPGTSSSVERDSGEPAAQPAVGAAVPDESGAAGQRSGDAGQGAGSQGSGQQDDQGLPASGPALVGKRGDLQLPGGKPPAGPASSAAGDLFGGRGPDAGDSGVPPDAIPARAVAAAAGATAERSKRDAQRAASAVAVKHGDLDNIRESLPYLLEGQQEDVHKAETRFAKPDGYGMLFTNGTGTGKTFTGLGIAKRFDRQGKNNILIVVPDQKILDDWVESGKPLDLNITPLADTKDAGRGIVITTYANLGANDELAKRDWDLIMPDEAHGLMQGAHGEATLYLDNLRAIAHHPDGAFTRFLMRNRDDNNRAAYLGNEIQANDKEASTPDTTDMRRQQLAYANAKLQAELTPLRAKLDAAKDAVYADVKARQGAARARAVFLSATPFAYEKTIDWANGFLFDYREGYPHTETSLGYNTPNPQQYFFITHLGYRMRTGKLTEPDAKVDRGLMQRQFNGWLKKQGVLSARLLDVPHDYDRRFILVDSKVGTQIDEALDWLSDKSYGDARIEGMSVVRDEIEAAFDYLSRRYLLEAIKAEEVVPIVKRHLALNRKVVVFHDYNKGGGFNPFDVREGTTPTLGSGAIFTQADVDRVAARNSAAAAFRAQFPELISMGFDKMRRPIDTFRANFGAELLLINGLEKKADLLRRYRQFQDDGSGPLVALVQSDKNKGWSGHDTTGKHKRVLINLGQPTQPTKSIQQEGRIYRIGQASDAIFRYLNTGTNWEKWAFATTIATRASTAENLGMGEHARALKDAYIAAFEESDAYPPGHEGEGTGGKERDSAANNALTEYDRAKAFYFGTQKKNSRTKAQEGKDYFATPEPVGLKMAQWADIKGGEDSLEPSGGHGAIARWLPELSRRVAIEPSSALRSRLALVFDGKIVEGTFEDHNVVNKYDGIVMNPPFGVGGKTAIDHLAKAAVHLRDGGRIVALIPRGPMADKRLDDFLHGERPSKPLYTDPKHGEIHKGDTLIMSGPYGGELKLIVGHIDGTGTGPRFARPDGEAVSSGVNLVALKGITPGPRTETKSRGLYLIADIVLPQVTFERAGTSVATHIVVLQQGENTPQQINRDYSDIDNINALFDKLEHLELAPRPERVAQPSAPAANPPARVPDPSAPTVTLPPVAVGDLVEAVTKAGKVLRGVLRPDLTLAQAKAIDPFTYRAKDKDGNPLNGWFIREKYLQGGNTAKEERAVYQVRDPQANYDIDLFPATLDGLQDDKAIPKLRKLAVVPARPAPTTLASPVLALREKAGTPGVFHVTSQLVQVGTRMLPSDRVIDWDGAADALSGLSRFAVEHFDVLITDANGKPMAIVGGFKGAVTQTSVYPATVAMEALRIEGAAHAWAVHNHPSGEARLSDADRRLSLTFDHLMFPSTVEYHGLAAVARQPDGTVKWSAIDADERDYKGQFTPGPATVPVPVVEREILTGNNVGASLTSPAHARELVRQVSGGQQGLLLLNTQNALTGWVPMRSLSQQKGKAYDELVNALASASTVSVVVANPGGAFTRASVADLKQRLALLDIRVLDAIDPDGGKTMAEQGVLEPDDLLTGYDRQAALEKQERERAALEAEEKAKNAKAPPGKKVTADQVDMFNAQGGLFFKTPGQAGGGMDRTAIDKAISQITRDWLRKPQIEILDSMEDAPPAMYREWMRDGGDATVHGIHARGTIYVLADGVQDAADVAEVLFHESLGHFGLRGFFGNGLDPVLDEFAARRPMQVGIKARQYGLDMSKLADRRLAAEEVLAEMAAMRPQLPIVQRLIAFIRTWLREHVAAFKDLALTDAEIINRFILPARGFVERGTSGKGTFNTGTGSDRAAQFSRGGHLGELNAAQERALKAVGALKQPKTLAQRFGELRANLGTRLAQGLFDQFAPIKDLDPKAYTMARLSKGSEGTMEAALLYGKPFLRDGVPDVNMADGGFAKVLAALKGEHDRFLWWVAANRAERLKAEGRENLFTDQDISDLKTLAAGNMADGSSRAQAFATALRGLNDYNDAVLKMAEESGLIDAEARELFKGQPYVPFYRVMEDEMTGPRFSSGLVNQTAYKKLKGGTSQLNDDLLENMLLNWAHLYTAAARNRAALATMEAADRLAIAYKINPHAGSTKKAVKVMRAGVAEHWQIEDPYLLEAVSALHYTPSPLMAPLAKMKQIMTFGVTVNPAFKVRNLLRDSIASMGLADMSYNPLKNVAQGWKTSGAHAQIYASMLASGGVMKFGTQENADRMRHKIAKLGGTMLDEGKWAHLTDSMGQLWDAYNELGDRSENVNRTALYERLIAKGKSHAEASFMARDLMDFSMSGRYALVRFLIQTVPFLNARLQGMYKLGRAAKEDPKRFAIIAASVSLASLALLGAYSDDEDWKKREDWDRDSNWWFKIGDTAYRIPRPFEIGAIGTLAERTAELMFSKEMTAQRFGDRLSFMVNQTFALNPVPQAVSPLFDVYANRDAFKRQPIESMHDKSLQPQDRHDERTSELARFLGQLGLPEPLALTKGEYNDLSPKQWDYLLRGYFSWIGASIASLTDYAIRPVMDRGERPDSKIRGGFVEPLPSGGSRYVSVFYDQAREAQEAFASYHAALKEGDTDRVAQLVGEGKVQNHVQAGRVRQRLDELNALAKRIEGNRLMSGEVKRAKLDEISTRRNEIASAYVLRKNP
jgi:hypothetical protein